MYESFMSVKKLELKLYILLGISSNMIILPRMITLKTFFSGNLSISFCLNANCWASICLFCFEYISNCPWLCLTGSDNAKSINKNAYIITANIKNIYARNTFIGITYIMGIWIEFAGIGNAYTEVICIKNAFIRGVELRILARLEIRLGNIGIKFGDRDVNALTWSKVIFIDTSANVNNCCY